MNKDTKLKNIFLGPKAENADIWRKYINLIFDDYVHWRRNYFPGDKIVIERSSMNSSWFDNLDYELNNTLNNLKAHFPFYSPRYMAHMLSEQLMPSVLGYFAGMLYNPNNVTSEAAPVTVDMEIDFGKKMCQMLGYKSGWAHICSGGTIANLEALWVAREIQFIPLCVKEYCEKYNIRFNTKTPNMSGVDKIDITQIDNRTLLSLKPNEKIYMLTKLIQYLCEKMQPNVAIEKVNRFLKEECQYSVRYCGFANVLAKVGLKPIIFVPESAHYSWEKSIAILGYGNVAIRKMPLNEKFRIDIKALKNLLFNLNENEYIVAVIGVVGTTEEGAVDPIHEIKFIRDKLENEKNMSFWLHVDAAWGGYVRSLFNNENYGDLFFDSNSELQKQYEKQLLKMRESLSKKGKQFTKLDESALKCSIIMDVNEVIADNESILGESTTNAKMERLAWADLDVIKSYMAIQDADSITVDPHKLGYAPYPAGVIAYKNKYVTQYVAQKAKYISENNGDIDKIVIENITSVGPYIIEGSKPGAAAVACWLSEQTIPMNLHNHGKIIKTTLLNAKKFLYYLSKFNKERTNYLVKNRQKVARPFMIVPLYNNIDTNIVCFVILPMLWNNKTNGSAIIKDFNLSLGKLNEVNKNIYRSFTIDNQTGEKLPPHTQKFFLSRTELEHTQYAFGSIERVFKNLEIKREEYESQGLFVLRATLMNPWYYDAAKEDNHGRKTDYFLEFFRELNKVIIEVINATIF